MTVSHAKLKDGKKVPNFDILPQFPRKKGCNFYLHFWQAAAITAKTTSWVYSLSPGYDWWIMAYLRCRISITDISFTERIIMMRVMKYAIHNSSWNGAATRFRIALALGCLKKACTLWFSFQFLLVRNKGFTTVKNLVNWGKIMVLTYPLLWELDNLVEGLVM